MARTPAKGSGDLEQVGSERNAAEVTQTIPTASVARKKHPNTDLILGLLRRQEGATREQMSEATGWLPHTTRAALTGLKKMGHVITSEKPDGVRTYKVTAVSKV